LFLNINIPHTEQQWLRSLIQKADDAITLPKNSTTFENALYIVYNGFKIDVNYNMQYILNE
jgi:hypothetical protein